MKKFNDAADFRVKTAQKLKKMMDVIQEIEHQLVQVLIENAPGAHARETMQRKAEDQWKSDNARRNEELLNGPQVKDNVPDTVSGQDQVDDLLDELGF